MQTYVLNFVGKKISGKSEIEVAIVIFFNIFFRVQNLLLIRKPSCLADHCKMHGYQLEGLNWLIKLHCNGLWYSS